MLGWLMQMGKASHAGSSVMPNKTNPWFFEVGQGSFEKANRLIDGATEGLLPSVFERDLTDHPWERSYGEMIGKSLVGIRYVSDGLKALRVNDEQALNELEHAPEVLLEAVQIAGRIAEVPDIYMTIKNLTRGRKLDFPILHQIIEENIPDGEMKENLLALQPEDYVGKAPEIARRTAEKYQKVRSRVERGVLDESKKIDAVLFDFDGTLQV